MKKMIAVVMLALGSPALAADLAQCASITSSVERLTCYDNLARQRTTAKEAPARSSSVSGRCQATTKKGAQCKRSAKPGSRYCWQHGG